VRHAYIHAYIQPVRDTDNHTYIQTNTYIHTYKHTNIQAYIE